MKKILICLLLLLSQNALALTPTEKATLKAAALAETSIITCIEIGNDDCVSAWFNSVTTFVAWRTNVPASEYHNSAIVWTAVDSLTVGKARIWEWMSKYGNIDPSKANVRQGFADAFGAASATTVAATALSKRFATTAEKILSTGIGTTAAPGLMTFEGTLSSTDVSIILRN
jgi:hypothetical protein